MFWNVAPCRSCVNRRFGETYHLHLLDRKIRGRGSSVSTWLAICSRSQIFLLWRWRRYVPSETSVHTRYTRRYMPEDGILHSHRCKNLKFYKVNDIISILLRNNQGKLFRLNPVVLTVAARLQTTPAVPIWRPSPNYAAQLTRTSADLVHTGSQN
jgi:hypothetical protein